MDTGLSFTVTAFVVMIVLAAVPLMPFCKFRRRVYKYHQDLWVSRGPFDMRSMLAYGHLTADFIDFSTAAYRDESIVARDAELAALSQTCADVWQMRPKSFFGAVFYFLVYMYFSGFIAYGLINLFGGG